MVRQTFKAFGILIGLMAFVIPVSAGEQKANTGGKSGQTQQISGTVIREKTVDVKGEDTEHRVILLQTQDGKRVVADLGAADNLEGIDIRHGKQLDLRGMVVRVSDRPVILVSQIGADGRTIQVDRPELARADDAGIEPRKLDFTKSIDVSGQVVAEKTVEVEDLAGGNKVVLLELETGDTLVADLGSAEGLPMDVQKGEQLEIQGRIALVGDRMVLMAEKVAADGKSAQIERFIQQQEY